MTPSSTLADAVTDAAPDAVYDAFVSWAEGRGIRLYPAQDEAAIELVSGSHVVLSTPTGTGKSLVAIAAHTASLARGGRSYYTAPIKALVAEKFFALVEIFGAENVGMVTGDSSVNADAPIVCCTAEILANIALRQGTDADIDAVVMDEFHYYGDPERGWAWQVPLLLLPRVQFLLMSATLGDVTPIVSDLERRTGREVAQITGVERPVPLHFSYERRPVHDVVERLLEEAETPIYIVHFSQAAALERAQALINTKIASREQRDQIAAEIGGFRFTTGFGKTLSRLVRAGIGIHHAGMLPRYRRLVETLAQRGLLKVICGTDTLGVGINVPIRTVLITALTKFDGTRMRQLSAREFHQVAGRAGRAGFDPYGNVVVMAPEWEIENAVALAKAGDDAAKRKKTIFRTLRTAGIVDADADGIRLTVDLQPNFALNQPLSPFALAAISLLDPDASALATPSVPTNSAESHELRSPEPESSEPGANLRTSGATTTAGTGHYALDVVSVIEATLDDPRAILSQQEFRARGEAVAAMKRDGLEYDERMALLEEITHPKPLAELLAQSFAVFASSQPWVLDFELSPKSVVRDMYERAMSFGEFVSFYQLARSEGLVLRYLSDAYRAVRQTVPAEAHTDDLLDLIEWLGELVRQVDSSLVDEWSALIDPAADPEAPVVPPAPPSVLTNRRAFTVLVRNELFRRVQLAALQDDDALAELDPGVDWSAAMDRYYDEHDEILTGGPARSPQLCVIDTTDADTWRVEQIIDDPAGDHDWRIRAEVDLAASVEEGTAVVRVTEVVRL
ncbi:DUF3516 domain-containing protein [uncultured Microbacterium sp.]|uniref:DEAD/DEAH box helicase n=3 Tax=Microbacterium TaxID=33882 RepID=UPI0032B113B1